MSEPNRLGAKEAASRIACGELSSEELLRSCLERIAARENQVRAWTYLVPRIGLAQAKAADAPLHGVPVGVKDIFDTHDMPTGYGSRIYAGHQPRADAAAVALARRAGATIVGKTATCELATFVPTVTRNPHDPARTPGGSSSGSAAAVADFMVPLAFGTQTAGSLIRPGSYCGVVAYKPTYNLLPRAGVKAQADTLDTVGVYARSVEDVAFFTAQLTGRRDLEGAIERPRIAVCRTHEWEAVQPEMAQCLERTARALSLQEATLPERFRGLRAAHAAILCYEVARSFADELARFPDQMDAALRERCEAGLTMDVEEYVAALAHAAACRARLDEAFGDYDVLLAPAATGEAPLGEATGDIAMNVVWTLLHAPCVSLPAGIGPNGMPLGLQVIGRAGDDARTLACAKWLASRLEGYNPPHNL